MVRIAIFSILMLASFILSLLDFIKKGIILDDNYVFASKEARERMDKKAYYLQSAIVFLLLGVMFLFHTLRLLLDIVWFTYAAFVIAFVAIVYVIVSHYAIKKKAK